MFKLRGLSDAVAHKLLLVAAANDEAGRLGHQMIDTDHLLLGLIATGGPAAELLRAHEVDLTNARQAMLEVQRHDLQAVEMEMPDTELHAPIRYDVATRPLTDAAAAVAYDDRGDLGVLRELVSDPMSRAARLLKELGVELSENQFLAVEASPPRLVRAQWETTYSTVIGVPRMSVWALLDDPSRRPSWDTDVTSVELVSEDHFIGRSPISSEDSRLAALVARGGSTDIRHDVVDRTSGRAIEWRILFPRKAHTEHLRVELTDAPTGTRVTLLHRGGHRNGLRGRLMRWLVNNQLKLRAQAIHQALA